jgi:hypothetical protein
MTTMHLVLRYAHISAGVLTLASGALAMTFSKGSWLHRRAGNVFFVSMLILSAAGVVLSLIKTPNMGNIMGGTTAFYMVATAWATVIRKPGETGRFEIVAALAGLAVTVAAISFGVQALLSPNGRFHEYPALMYFIFASVLMMGTAGDARMIVRGGLTGTARTTRHLWRMCLAFFMATGSFFFGQPTFLPAGIRDTALRPIFALLPLGLLLYWLIRVRVWPSLRRIAAHRYARATLSTR